MIAKQPKLEVCSTLFACQKKQVCRWCPPQPPKRKRNNSKACQFSPEKKWTPHHQSQWHGTGNTYTYANQMWQPKECTAAFVGFTPLNTSLSSSAVYMPRLQAALAEGTGAPAVLICLTIFARPAAQTESWTNPVSNASKTKHVWELYVKYLDHILLYIYTGWPGTHTSNQDEHSTRPMWRLI